MESTRPAGRSWIDKEHPTITATLKRYPRLQDTNQAVSVLHDNCDRVKWE